MLLWCIFLLPPLILAIPDIEFETRYTAEIRNYSCMVFDQQIKLFECSYQKITPIHYLFNKRLMFNRDMGKELMVHIKIDVQFKRSSRIVRFFDEKISLCEVFSSQRFAKIVLQNLLRELRQTSNLPDKCPLKGNFMYQQTNLSVTPRHYPFLLPPLNASLILDYYNAQNKIGSTILEGVIEAK